MTYQVLSREAGTRTRLVIPPASVWVISTLEVAISHQGKTSLLLTYPSYPLSGQPISDSHHEGHWAPPFMAYPVETGFSPPTTFESVQGLVDTALSKVDVRKDMQQLCYQMGLRDVHLSERESFLELKVSPREPSLVKAYWILRHALIDVDEACVANLADAEVRRGYVHLPIDLDAQVVSARREPNRERVELWFLGKPVQSNVEYVLRSPDRRAAIEQTALVVDPSAFAKDETGILCAVDLAGYGTALKYAGDHMHSPGIDGIDAQSIIRQRIITLLERMLAETGATQAQVAGDGFIAAFPDRVYPNRDSTIRRVLESWNRVLEAASILNGEIRTETSRVGSRIALHAGAYRYGRISGTNSFLPSFDGQSIVDVARLEQGLAANNTLQLGVHRLVASSALTENLGGINESGWHAQGKGPLTSKEFSEQAWLYSRLEEGDR